MPDEETTLKYVRHADIADLKARGWVVTSRTCDMSHHSKYGVIMEYRNDDQATELARYMLEEHEGLRLKPYVDTTGHTSIGYGRNLDSMGIREIEADIMLSNDITAVRDELEETFEWYPRMTDTRRAALINMSFSLGLPRLRSFGLMLAALNAGEYETAAEELLDSKYARQVGKRANDLAAMIRGQPYAVEVELICSLCATEIEPADPDATPYQLGDITWKCYEERRPISWPGL